MFPIACMKQVMQYKRNLETRKCRLEMILTRKYNSTSGDRFQI